MKTRFLRTAHFYGLSTVSRLIQRQTGPYSHSAVFCGKQEQEYINQMMPTDGMIGVELMEQWPHGGRIKSWMDFSSFGAHTKGTKYEIWALEVPLLDWEYCMNRYVKSCEDKRPYDWAGIAHFEIKSIKEDPEKTFCSEEIVTPIVEIKNWDTIKPFNVHPTGLVNIIQAAGGFLLKSGQVK